MFKTIQMDGLVIIFIPQKVEYDFVETYDKLEKKTLWFLE